MFHWQNLNDGKHPKAGGIIRYGRAWWRTLSWEWSFLWGKDLRFSFSYSGFSIALLIFSFYFHWSDHEMNSYEFCLYFYGWAVWLGIWHNIMESRLDDPFWKRMLVFHIDDFLLGRYQFTKEVGETQEVLIPMQEGCYRAKITFEKLTWKRPRWFPKTKESCDIQIPGGIPFSGKGENSWDCGDDGLWATGSNGHNIPNAIATVVRSVMETRLSRGNTTRVLEAMSHIIAQNEKDFES